MFSVGSVDVSVDLQLIGSHVPPWPEGPSQYYWASSPSYSLVIFVVQVLGDGHLCSMLQVLIIEAVYLFRELGVILFGVLLLLLHLEFGGTRLLFLELAMRVPLLGDDLMSLGFAEAEGHLLALLLGVVCLGGHEGSRLGCFEGLQS